MDTTATIEAIQALQGSVDTYAALGLAALGIIAAFIFTARVKGGL